MTTLLLTAHGSVDPRSAANAGAIMDQVAGIRPSLDVRVAYCEHSSPGLVDILNECSGKTVVVPLLLTNAYHARIDIPRQIASCGANHRVRQANVLGEDDRLVSVLRQRVTQLGFSLLDDKLGVLVAAIGSADPAANARTTTVAAKLATGTRWAAATTAFITGSQSPLPEAVNQLRRKGARRMVIAAWFLAPGQLPDRVQRFANQTGIAMTAPLGAHPLVAETVLDRFEQAVKAQTQDVAAQELPYTSHTKPTPN